MKPSDELFQLIKSLNKTEKGYFKKYASTHIIGEKNNYMKLFEAIDKQKVYNEEAIKKTFAKETFIKHLPSEKNYLSDLILRSLTSYATSTISIEFKIRELLQQVEVLFKKSLYKQCKKLLAKAKNLAYEYENNILLLNIFEWEKNIMSMEFYLSVSIDDIEKLHKEELLAIQKVQNTYDYWKLNAKVYHLQSSKGTARNEQEIANFMNLIEKKEYDNERQALSYLAKVYQYHAYGYYNYSINEYKKSYEYFLKEITLWENNPLQIKEHTASYLLALNNMASVCGRLKKFDERLDYIDKIKSIPQKWTKTSYEDMDSKIFLRVCAFETDTYLKTGEFEKGLALIPKIEQGFKDYGDKLTQRRTILIVYYNISYLYFIAGNFSKALHWQNRILNHPNIDVAEDIICFSKILNLLIHFELNNDMLLEYVVKSTYRFLYKKNRLYKLEVLILNFIRKKLPSMTTPQKRIDNFIELRDQIIEISKDPYDTGIFEYFDFIEWLQSKIEGRPFAAILREKAKQRQIA